MPAHIFDDIVAARFRTAAHRPMAQETAGGYLAPWAGPEGQQRWIDQVTAVSFEDTREAVARLGESPFPPSSCGATGPVAADRHGRPLAAAIPGAEQATSPERATSLPRTTPRSTAKALLRFFRLKWGVEDVGYG